MIFFLIVSGIDFYFQVSFMNQRQVQYTIQEAFFNSVFFWFAFVLIFPLITMRLFAEEFKLGTIEPLTTAPVRDWQVVLSKFFGALVFYVILWIPTLLYFSIFAKSHKPAGCAFSGSILRLLPDAVVPRNVLSFHWLSNIRADPEPDHRRDHFFLRNYAAVFSRSGSVHSAGCNLRNARFAGLLFCDRTHGNVLAGCHRYAANRSLREHDHRDADAHVSGIPIPEMEALSYG